MSNNWRENIINVVTRDHMVDKNLEDRINKNIEIPFRMTMVFEKIFWNILKYIMEYILYYKIA